MEKWLERFARASFKRSGDTAHDLKTPLNVAVLNLELLRMRIAKLSDGTADDKINGYTSAIETELRRLGRIFDLFFILSTPPKGEDAPLPVDIAPLAREGAQAVGFELNGVASIHVRAHESRMRQALKLFFEGASKIFSSQDRVANAAVTDQRFEMTITGKPAGEELDLTKIFKFYYTDDSGTPDLSLAAARLIAETYGGEVEALEDRGKVVLRLAIPLGDP